MKSVANKGAHRIVFFDNMRSFLVISVIILHGCLAYSNHTWWPVSESGSSIFVMSILAIIDVFCMPLLFFVSGYFAVVSISRKKISSFMKSKLKRLGLPWILAIVTICPILPWIYHHTREDAAASLPYRTLWLTIMKAMGEFNVRVIDSMDVLMQHDHYYQRYMWFISLLLLFFFLFALIYTVKPGWFSVSQSEKVNTYTTRGFVLRLFLLVSLTTCAGSFILIALMFQLSPQTTNPGALFTLANIVQFRPSSIFTLISFFTLGLFTYKYKWIERGFFSRHLGTWIILFWITLFLFMASLVLLVSNPNISQSIAPDDMVKILSVINFFFRHFLLTSMLGLFTSLMYRYWNEETSFNRKLSSVSYYMYLSHYLIVLGIQMLLLSFQGIPVIIKFQIVVVTSIFLSYLVSLRVIKPYPRATSLLVIGLFISMMIFL